MDAVLSVQGASAPVKKKSFFSKFTRLNMLRLARAVIPAAVLMMFFSQLAMAAGSSGQDLMASGNTTVKATFGKDSSVVKWVGRPCDDGADCWSGVLYREITTPFLVRGFFPDVLCLSSYCAGRSGCVTGMMLALILLINKQHNTGYL